MQWKKRNDKSMQDIGEERIKKRIERFKKRHPERAEVFYRVLEKWPMQTPLFRTIQDGGNNVVSRDEIHQMHREMRESIKGGAGG